MIDDLRALTLIRPMGQAIVYGTKRIENRPRDLPAKMKGKRTIVAVHAGKGYDAAYLDSIISIDAVEGVLPYAEHIADEGIIGLMMLSGRVFTESEKPWRQPALGDKCPWFERLYPGCDVGLDPWYSGPFGYEIVDAVAFPRVFKCSGMLGFWRVAQQVPKVYDELRELFCAACSWYHPDGQPRRHCVLR